MNLGTKTGATRYTLESFRQLHAVLIKKEHAGNVINNETMSIKLIRNQKSDIVLLDTIKLIDLAQSAQQDEEMFLNIGGLGIMKHRLTAVPSMALDMAIAGEHIEIKLDGCTAGAEYNVYGVEAFGKTDVFLQQNDQSCTSSDHLFNTRGYDELLLPKTNFTGIKVKRGNQEIEISKEEMVDLGRITGEVKTVGPFDGTVVNSEVVLDAQIVKMFEVDGYLQVGVTDVDSVRILAQDGYQFKSVRNIRKGEIV